MNRTYEIMFIVRPDVEEADLDKLIEGFSANVTNGGGEIKSVEKMGRRRERQPDADHAVHQRQGRSEDGMQEPAAPWIACCLFRQPCVIPLRYVVPSPAPDTLWSL